MRKSDDLRAEYLMIQGQYEAFDQRALSLKALATPLLGAGLAVGLSQGRRSVLLTTIAVAGSLWLLETIWKSFQYCFSDRIMKLEEWFRGEGDEDLPAFQTFTSWRQLWNGRYRRPGSWPSIAVQPFVCLPYLVIVLAGAIALARLS